MNRHRIVLTFALVLVAVVVNCVSGPPPAEPAPAPVPEAPPPAAQPAAMEPGVNRGGNDIQNMDLTAADPALCAAECDKNPQCVAWTYVKPGIQNENARCWLKNPVPEPHPDDCCTSGVKAAP